MTFRPARVVCLYPYEREVPIYGFFPPIGLEYVAAAIADLAGEIVMLDFRQERDPARSLRKAVEEGVDLFCVCVNWEYEFDSVCEVIRSLPAGIPTVVGGRHATENVEEIFRLCPNVGLVVRGDGEETLREYLEKGSPEGVDGISFRSDGRIVHNRNRELKPVSDTALPLRSARRIPYRIQYQKVDLGRSFDAVVASRGCPYNCKFCSFKRNPLGQKRAFSARSPESVVAELKLVGAQIVAFLDDNFFVDLRRAERICDLILQEGIRKQYIVNARISIGLHPRLLRKLHRAGFRLLMIGIESAQDKSLASLNKGFKTADVREAFRGLRASNMMTGGYFIVGLVGETRREMLEIGPFASEIGVDFIHLNRLRFEKFSGLGEILAENPGYYIGEKNRIYSREYGPREINAILKKIRNRFFGPWKMASLLLKGVRIGFPAWDVFARLILNLPRIGWRLALRKRKQRKAPFQACVPQEIS
jgi:anaerobic magnesium-protoporphyrin IX monomethyl ester cyclase